MISNPNLFNASHEISKNQGANLGAKNIYLRIQCMKCGGYGHIQAECANTWSDDESKACNEGDDLCHESMIPVNLFLAEQCSSDPIISAYGPPIDPLTYESPSSMTTLAPIICCDN